MRITAAYIVRARTERLSIIFLMFLHHLAWFILANNMHDDISSSQQDMLIESDRRTVTYLWIVPFYCLTCTILCALYVSNLYFFYASGKTLFANFVPVYSMRRTEDFCADKMWQFSATWGLFYQLKPLFLSQFQFIGRPRELTRPWNCSAS